MAGREPVPVHVGTQMSTNILVIHPYDPTTQFLREIYRGLDCKVMFDFTVYNGKEKKALKNLIRKYDTIIMLGHGSDLGLYDRLQARYIIDSSFADILRTKKIIGIWCHANIYFLNNALVGFHSGMFISEPDEAGVYGVDAGEDCHFLTESNELFAKVMGDALREGKNVKEYVNHNYTTDGSNEVITANRKFMFG